MMEFETTILGGLPVTIEYTVAPAEPDVGVMYSYIEDMIIVAVNRKPIKNTAWIEKRMTTKDWEKVNDKCADDYSERARQSRKY